MTCLGFCCELEVIFSPRLKVKAASHIAPRGFNDTDEAGILVDMGRLKEITWHPEANTIDVGPGLIWTDIYSYFEENNIPYNVTGATSCQGIGVAGFLLGGGYGNKANQYGLAMDCIKSIEVVLPTGQVVVARHDGDKLEQLLFWALRVCFHLLRRHNTLLTICHG